jgi:hypothetical protein
MKREKKQIKDEDLKLMLLPERNGVSLSAVSQSVSYCFARK